MKRRFYHGIHNYDRLNVRSAVLHADPTWKKAETAGTADARWFEEGRYHHHHWHKIASICGIIGKVVYSDKDTFVIETSEDRVLVQFDKWALSTVGVQTGEQNKKKKKEESAATEGADSSTPAEVPAETTSETDEEK